MIEVQGLTRYYGEFPAVKDVTFSIDDNVIVGFLGLNGAGKSTVMKMLGGLVSPSAGHVKVDSVDVADAPDSFKTKIGYLPEEPPLYRDMRVNDFLAWCGEIKGMSKSEVAKRLPETLKMCQLEERANHVIDTLSHGYRKRVGIAQAIIHRPKMVLLDEPISGLDPVQIREMRGVLRSLTSFCTVFVSSHILSEISQVCDRVIVLNNGQVVADRDIQSNKNEHLYRVRTNRSGIEDFFHQMSIVTNATAVDSTKNQTAYELTLTEPAPNIVVKSLVNSGHDVFEIVPAKSDLERIFVSLVDGSHATDNSATEEQE